MDNQDVQKAIAAVKANPIGGLMHINAAVNAVPLLIAEVDRLRAQLEALVGLVERWPELDCASWCSDLRCTCGAEDQNLTRAAARLALGLEVTK